MAKETDQPKNEVSVFIEQAIEKGLPVETLERLFALREKVKVEQAEDAFTGALAKFQSDCPVIKKTKKVNGKDGRLRYMYAPLDSIVEQIKKAVAVNGLSYTWDSQNIDKSMKVTCKLTHILGHSKTSSMEIPIGTEEYMTEPQKYASRLTFTKRYTLCNVLGISTGDEDTDATDVGKEKTPKSPKSKIVFLLRNLGDDTKTKESVQDAVMKRTGLDLEEANYGEIVFPIRSPSPATK